MSKLQLVPTEAIQTLRYVNIDGEWLNNQQFADNLNNYYVSIIDSDTQLNMPELPTTANDCTVPDKVNIWDIYKHHQLSSRNRNLSQIVEVSGDQPDTKSTKTGNLQRFPPDIAALSSEQNYRKIHNQRAS